MEDAFQPGRAKNPMNSTPPCQLSRRYEVFPRAGAAGLLERNYNLSLVVCSWHICSADRLERASILSCAVYSVLRENFSESPCGCTEENIPQATEVR